MMAFAIEGFGIAGGNGGPKESEDENKKPAATLEEILDRRLLGQANDRVIYMDTLSNSALLIEHFGKNTAVCHGIIINGVDELKKRWEQAGGSAAHCSCNGVYFPFGNTYQVTQGYFIDDQGAFLGYMHSHSFGYCFPIMPDIAAPQSEMKKMARRIGLYRFDLLIPQQGRYYSFITSFFMASTYDCIPVIQDFEHGFHPLPMGQ